VKNIILNLNFAQQLREDRPELIERIKRMQLPISRYPSIASHALPPPVGPLRDMPGMRLSQLRNREVSWEEYIKNEWIAETHTLVPNWHFDGNRIIMSNPLKGTPITLEQLPLYRIPRKEERLYGGTLALEEVFGVIPLDLFPGLFENDPGRQRVSAVSKALGMGAFEYSRQSVAANSAPFRATNLEMVKWFYEHFPVERALHSDVGWNYTHAYNGNYTGQSDIIAPQLNEDVIKYAVEHPEDFKIVWPDPERIQYLPENHPLEFFKKEYGVSSLKEVLDMAPPIRKIMSIDPTPSRRMVTKGETVPRVNWQKDFLFTLSELGVTSSGTSLPDFLRAKEEIIVREEIFKAAKYITDNATLARPRGESDIKQLPPNIELENRILPLGKTFIAFANFLTRFGVYDELPAGVTVREMIGPVDYPLQHIDTVEELDEQVGRISGIPEDPYINEVNLLHAVWEMCEKMEKDQKIPAKIPIRISRSKRGNYTGQRSQVNTAEMLYAMAQTINIINKEGLPDEVPFVRFTMLNSSVAFPSRNSSTAWRLQSGWMESEFRQEYEKTVSKDQILDAAEYLMAVWTAGHLGHAEDIGGPPYYIPLKSGDVWSLNDTYQALAFSLIEYTKSKRLPDLVTIKEALGPVNYPMYELQGELMYNIRMLRTGWQPYQVDKRNFPNPNDINKQGVPGPGHGMYVDFEKADDLLEAVQKAVASLEETGIIPGSIPIMLRNRRGDPFGPYPGSTDETPYINAAETLWGMSQLYRYIAVLGKADDVYMRSCRMIQDQLHSYVVDFDPIGFSRQTYRYRQDSFDWIEKVPVWRIHKTWSYVPH